MKNLFSAKMQSVLMHAAIIAGVMMLHNIVTDITGLYLSTYNRIAGMLIPLLGFIYVIYAYRKESCDNVISYSKALGYGTLVAILFAIVMPAFSYLHTHYISPDLLEQVQAFTEEKMMGRGLSDYQIEQALERGEKFKTFGWSMIFGVPMMFIFGFIYSLIAAAIVKKESNNPFEGVE
ncbi:MAG: DUF4199 domain-containing protein [Bacteroidales bacterium]|nr:DUF4199 domain-containing protein [Bacteroidales bacterium]MCF8390564.1 DUF4199 domain-containing protein [Bacteroidales bacterium]